MPRANGSLLREARNYLDEMKADYAAMRPSRFIKKRIGIAPDGGSADYHYRSQAKYMRLVEDARDMDRNDAIIGQGIDRSVANILRRGFSLDVNTGDTKLDWDLQHDFEDWCNDPDRCDMAGEMTFLDFERLGLRSSMVDGDSVILPVEEANALQMVEAHRIRTPTNTSRNVIHGVFVDDFRKRLEYWISKDDIDPMKSIARVGDMKRWPVRDEDGKRQLFHIYDPKRSTQTRGVSVLAPVFQFAGMFQDTNVAMIAKQQLASSIGLIRKMENPLGPNGFGGTQSEIGPDGNPQTVVSNAGPAIEFRTGMNDDVKAFSPQIPRDEFFEHMKLILTIIGLNLGLPLVMLLMDGSETNFSGWRGAIDQSKLRFEQVQDQFARRLHIPLYQWWLRRRIENEGALRRTIESNQANSGFDVFGHAWVAPTWPYVQPVQDAQTDGLRLKYRLISPRGICAERGKNFDRIIQETVQDHEMAITQAVQAADRINQKHQNANVNWREIWSTPVVEGVTIPQEGEEPNGRPNRNRNDD